MNYQALSKFFAKKNHTHADLVTLDNLSGTLAAHALEGGGGGGLTEAQVLNLVYLTNNTAGEANLVGNQAVGTLPVKLEFKRAWESYVFNFDDGSSTFFCPGTQMYKIGLQVSGTTNIVTWAEIRVNGTPVVSTNSGNKSQQSIHKLIPLFFADEVTAWVRCSQSGNIDGSPLRTWLTWEYAGNWLP